MRKRALSNIKGYKIKPREFKDIQMNDNIKNKYSKLNKIDLLRIPYYKIELILKKKLKI